MTPLADPVVWFGLTIAALIVAPAVVQAAAWEADDWRACHPASSVEPAAVADGGFTGWAVDIEWEDSP